MQEVWVWAVIPVGPIFSPTFSNWNCLTIGVLKIMFISINYTKHFQKINRLITLYGGITYRLQPHSSFILAQGWPKLSLEGIGPNTLRTSLAAISRSTFLNNPLIASIVGNYINRIIVPIGYMYWYLILIAVSTTSNYSLALQCVNIGCFW